MFNTFTKTPQDFYNQASKYFAVVPKTTGEVKKILDKITNVVNTEVKNAQSIYATYQKITTGDASVNEINEANKKAEELMIATRFAMLMAIPGAVVVLPTIIETAKDFDVKIVPESVKEEFNI